MKMKKIFKRSVLFASAVFAICIVLAASSYGIGKKKVAGPTDAFDHEMHNKIFEGTVKCEHCHINDVYDRTGILSNWRKAGKVGCHDCHKADTSNPIMPVPKDCKVCHKVWPKPDSHNVNWDKVHQSQAKQNAKYCEQCHEAFFCIDCHKRRDTIQTRMHDRNFISTHSIEARANPRRCDSCHALAYCKRCHSTR